MRIEEQTKKTDPNMIWGILNANNQANEHVETTDARMIQAAD